MKQMRSLTELVVISVALLFTIGGALLASSHRDNSQTNIVPEGTPAEATDYSFLGSQSEVGAQEDGLEGVPEGAEVDSEDKAAEQAEHLLDAENPRILSVELLTLEEAFIASQELWDEDPELALAGWSREELDSLVWRVIVEADKVSVPASCEPPDDSENGNAADCLPPPSPSEMIFDPIDGSWIHATFGFSQ